jgi:hypothetical protein
MSFLTFVLPDPYGSSTHWGRDGSPPDSFATLGLAEAPLSGAHHHHEH